MDSTLPQPSARLVSLDDFCARAGLRTPAGRPARRRGRRLLRQFRTVTLGRDLYTTEEWLMEGLAERALPPVLAGRRGLTLDPLRDEVLHMAVELLRDLARSGVVTLKAI